MLICRRQRGLSSGVVRLDMMTPIISSGISPICSGKSNQQRTLLGEFGKRGFHSGISSEHTSHKCRHPMKLSWGCHETMVAVKKLHREDAR